MSDWIYFSSFLSAASLRAACATSIPAQAYPDQTALHAFLQKTGRHLHFGTRAPLLPMHYIVRYFFFNFSGDRLFEQFPEFLERSGIRMLLDNIQEHNRQVHASAAIMVPTARNQNILA